VSDTTEPSDQPGPGEPGREQPGRDQPIDLRERLKQLTQPIVDSLDARLRKQIDERVDERVDTSLTNRLAVLERAIADLDRAVKRLQERLGDDV
jgi:hypothetical protein